MKKLCILLALISLSGCSLLGVLGEPQKLIKNVAVTGVAFATGGVVPAVVVGGFWLCFCCVGLFLVACWLFLVVFVFCLIVVGCV